MWVNVSNSIYNVFHLSFIRFSFSIIINVFALFMLYLFSRTIYQIEELHEFNDCVGEGGHHWDTGYSGTA